MSLNKFLSLISVQFVTANINYIPTLTSSNFAEWKEYVTVILSCMDLDYALRNDHPAPLTSANTIEQRVEFQLWEKLNRMCLSIMNLSIPVPIKGSITEGEDAKSFLNQLANRFTSNEKVETTTLLTKLVTMRYNGKGNIREYIMEMSNIATSLKALKLDMSEGMLVHFVLMSLPARFTPFKISYNTQKEKWTLNELIAQCVQEEGRLKIETSESAHLASGSQSASKK